MLSGQRLSSDNCGNFSSHCVMFDQKFFCVQKDDRSIFQLISTFCIFSNFTVGERAFVLPKITFSSEPVVMTTLGRVGEFDHEV